MIVEVPNRNAGLDFGGVEHPMVFSEKSFSSMCAAATPTGSFFTHSKGNGAHNKFLLAILTAPDVRTEDGDSFSLRNREATVSFVNLGHGVLWKLLNRIFIYSLVAIAKQKSRHSG